jgi:hypothetical protein
MIAKKKWGGYSKWLTSHIAKSFQLRENRSDFSRPVELRSAHIIFMLVVCEIVFVATIKDEPGSWFGTIGCYLWIVRSAVAAAVALAVWQYYILFNVDDEIVANPGVSAESNSG